MIIGVTGYAQHGKDTVGKFLVEQYGFKHMAFATKVKEAALAINPIVGGRDVFDFYQDMFQRNGDVNSFREYAVLLSGNGHVRLDYLICVMGWELAKKHPEVRRLLQYIGTDMGREILGKDTWVDAVRDEIKLSRGNIVFTDMRFINEACFIWSKGGQVWKVFRPDFDNGVGTAHESEQEIDKIQQDSLLLNDGSVEQLQDQAARYLDCLRIYPI